MSLDPAKVYETARSLLPAANRYAHKTGLDPALAEDLMMETVYHVIHGDFEIKNLPAYLYTSFKNRVFEERHRIRRYKDLSEEELVSLSDKQEAMNKIEFEILKEDIARRLNPQNKFIFNYRLQGYSFDEISVMFNETFKTRFAANAMRSIYSRAVKQLAKQLQEQLPKD